MAETRTTNSKTPDELTEDEREELAGKAAEGDGRALALLLGVPVDAQMFDGLMPGTCELRVENIELNHSRYRALAYDLVEIGCSGDEPYELGRRRIDDSLTVGYQMPVDSLRETIFVVNLRIKASSAGRCRCV